MKYMGVDYGTKRIGIAISDDNGEFAFPKTILDADSQSPQAVATLASQEGVVGIVIGESLATNGAPNALVEQTVRFKEKLGSITTVPLYLEREGFSTVEAHRYQPTKGARDDSAAAIILQRFLDKHPQ